MESKTLDKIPYLPQEIIIDILSRIPVKFLLKFKSTSKSWYSLISSKNFVDAHLKNSTKNSTSAYHRILLVDKFKYELQHCSLRSLSLKQVTDAKRGEFPIDKSVELLEVVGSCNGLICILINMKYFFVWNPAMAESKKLPNLDVSDFVTEHGFGFDESNGDCVTEHGFGFDESSGDYKVYAVSGQRPTIGNIYSLKTDSWTRINKAIVDGDVFNSESGIFVSDNLHWSRTKEDGDLDEERPSKRWYISSLDLKNEVYGIVEEPNVMHYFDMTFGVFHGCLAVLYTYFRGNVCTDFWILKQYGAKDSWSKLLTYDLRQDQVDFLVPPSYVIRPNEEVLFTMGSGVGIAAYNSKDNRFWDLTLNDLDEFFNLDIYVESLVSVNFQSIISDVDE